MAESDRDRPAIVYREDRTVLDAIRAEAAAEGLTQTKYLLALVEYARENRPKGHPVSKRILDRKRGGRRPKVVSNG